MGALGGPGGAVKNTKTECYTSNIDNSLRNYLDLVGEEQQHLAVGDLKQNQK